MKILNPRNLPQAIVNAATPEEREIRPHRIGVTTLIGPPYIRKLLVRYGHMIEECVEDRAYLVVGLAVAKYLEMNAPEGAVAERKISMECGPYTITGIPDVYENGVLHDYKYTSAWSFVFGKEEWVRQLNIYAYMLGLDGVDIREVRILAIFRDWDWREAQKNKDYPPYQIMEIPIQLWEPERTKAYIEERVKAHRQELPCTPEDRWRKPTTYAVMKEGRKSAVRVFTSQGKAIEYCEKEGLFSYESEFKAGFSLHERPGEDTRCLIRPNGNSYCPVAKFCDISRYKGEVHELHTGEEN